MIEIINVEINITGIVQGVGFRPFLFNLARDLDLRGTILNRGNAGVRLILQGKQIDINKFITDIRKKKPKISFIENIDVKEFVSDIIFRDLKIERSEQGRGVSLTLPPDIAICDDCLRDMYDSQKEKYFHYPFIACAVCGPRYSTVTELPYDRERSTMINFPLCKQAEPESCIQEYTNFENRRFHAQTFACSVCGPHYKLYSKQRNVIQESSIDEILQETAKRINEGEIIAVKGIGGVHLVANSDNEDTVLKLRRRKGDRKYKPFALMIPNLKIVKNVFKISKKESEFLTSFRKPIVLLERINSREDSGISKLIAPGLSNIGIMLPYSGIHHLLFDYVGDKPLIYTSGNKSYIPMAVENEKIFDQLHNLADAFLLHNRPIYQRVDDSVLRIHDNKVKLIRRSRGYVPEYHLLPFEVKIPGAIATGPLLATTGAILRRNRVFPTQHIGNVSHLESYEFLKDALLHMKTLLQINNSEIEFVACDAHPELITTKLAEELSREFKCNLFKVQHHYAHVLALMAENNIQEDERIIGIAVDGVGYGNDGNIWGGEIFSASYNDFQRMGQLEYQPMIGGDRCTKFPARMCASLVLNALGLDEAKKLIKKLRIEDDLEYKSSEMQTIISQFEKSRQESTSQSIPLTSSTGRIFDTVSYLLGASKIKTYRGEPAMRLEGMAMRGNPKNVELKIGYTKKNGIYEIQTSELVMKIIALVEEGKFNREDIAARFQIEFGKIFGKIAVKLSGEIKVYKIGLTGGVAYNYAFSKAIKDYVLKSGLTFLEHNNIPPGDAGISIGQLVGGISQKTVTS
ncbi:MAG: carbamoyltransferase HypF [Promethearchaeota archaeon]